MQISRGKIKCAQKVVIYGPEGIGKFTFAAQFPDPVFIDTEGSTKHLRPAQLLVKTARASGIPDDVLRAWIRAVEAELRKEIEKDHKKL